MGHADQIAQYVQLLVIREALVKGKAIPPVPSAHYLADGLKLLLDKQRAEIRFELLNEILGARAAEQARGMMLSKMAQDERQKIADIARMLAAFEQNDSSIQREGDPPQNL